MDELKQVSGVGLADPLEPVNYRLICTLAVTHVPLSPHARPFPCSLRSPIAIYYLTNSAPILSGHMADTTKQLR